MTTLVRVLVTARAVLVGVADTVVMATYGMLVSLVPPRGHWTLRAARLWSRVALWGCGVRVRVENLDRIPLDTPVVFMANHESWLDIPALLASIPVQVRFLAKRSLFSIPFLGWAMWAMEFIPVDRRNRRSAVKSFDAAAARIRTGRSILVFPEESRTPDGALQSFQRGGFLIAMKADVPIVPVGLEGPRQRLAKHRYLLTPGPITVRFGCPVATTGVSLGQREELTTEVRAAVDQLRRREDEDRGAGSAQATSGLR